MIKLCRTVQPVAQSEAKSTFCIMTSSTSLRKVGKEVHAEFVCLIVKVHPGQHGITDYKFSNALVSESNVILKLMCMGVEQYAKSSVKA